jgi:hypothetical protein
MVTSNSPLVAGVVSWLSTQVIPPIVAVPDGTVIVDPETGEGQSVSSALDTVYKASPVRVLTSTWFRPIVTLTDGLEGGALSVITLPAHIVSW